MRSTKYRILVFGIGGVGGYYGGQLARHYQGSEDVEIIFIARGEHLNQIRNHGLKLKTEKEDFVAIPAHVTDDPAALDPVDLVILATKTYDLPASLDMLAHIVDSNTVILPLLNGVDAAERTSAVLSQAKVLKGLVYVTSFISTPGEVTQYGAYDKILFGGDDRMAQELTRVEQIFKGVGIKAFIAEDIDVALWEKYLLISAIGSMTSYKRASVGALREDPDLMDKLRKMMEEVYELAGAKGVHLADDVIDKTMSKVEAFNYDAKSSMQLDFEKGKHTEVDTLTGFICQESNKYALQAPVSCMIYEALK